MKLIYLAIIALGAFVAIWVFFVVPAERRHHERKLEMVRKQIEKREGNCNEQAVEGGNPARNPEPVRLDQQFPNCTNITTFDIFGLRRPFPTTSI